MGFDLWHSISNNKTLRFLADPVTPIGKLLSGGYKDVKGAVSYTGKHLIKDVDGISSSFAMSMPLIIGGAIVVLVMMNKNR
jgi:hypothetical protein